MSTDAYKEIAREIGVKVAHHIESMYPDLSCWMASSTFLLSVRNCTQNEVMAIAQRAAQLEEALQLAKPYIEFYAEREMKSPSNNQEAVIETGEMLATVRRALAACYRLPPKTP
jgi:hypothetical protein